VGTSAGPVLFALFLWWFSTGAVLYAVGLPRRNVPSIIASATFAGVFALFGLSITSTDTSVSGAFIAFTCALVIWAWHEMTFLTGLITGPRTLPLQGRGDAISNKRAPLIPSIETVIYHEGAIALTLAVAALLTWGEPNQTGLWTLTILWVMRLSAKFNLYLGVPNLTEQFLPDHLAYLKGYFCRRPMNLLFPVSVTVSTAAAIMLAIEAASPSASTFEAASLTLLATLMALAVIEHWFMVLPLPSAELWSWGLSSRAQIPARDAAKPAQERLTKL
jgi:putative photosynthetic complex assembly protein 2